MQLIVFSRNESSEYGHESFKEGAPNVSYLLLRANYSAFSLLFNGTVTARVSTAVILMLVMIDKYF